MEDAELARRLDSIDSSIKELTASVSKSAEKSAFFEAQMQALQGEKTQLFTFWNNHTKVHEDLTKLLTTMESKAEAANRRLDDVEEDLKALEDPKVNEDLKAAVKGLETWKTGLLANEKLKNKIGLVVASILTILGGYSGAVVTWLLVFK